MRDLGSIQSPQNAFLLNLGLETLHLRVPRHCENALKVAKYLKKARELNQKLVEAAAENDETLMEKFFEQGSLTEDEMREGIRKGLITRSIYPVFCVSALRDMGVRRMMEFLGNVVRFCSDSIRRRCACTVRFSPKSPALSGTLLRRRNLAKSRARTLS